MKLHPQYITNSKGKRISVVLPIKEYEALIEELEDLHNIELYDQPGSEPENYMAVEEDAFKYIGKTTKISRNQMAVAKSRLKAYKKDPSRGIPWEKAKKELDKKYKK